MIVLTAKYPSQSAADAAAAFRARTAGQEAFLLEVPGAGGETAAGSSP